MRKLDKKEKNKSLHVVEIGAWSSLVVEVVVSAAHGGGTVLGGGGVCALSLAWVSCKNFEMK